jgi:two-component system sensor histidine kinase ChvG
MTNALYARIEAIESFAADVSQAEEPAHPLRSAVETLPLAKNENSRSRLMEIIQHDVRRLDRLITDISDASRLDAELAREDAGTVDLKKFITDLVAVRARPRATRKLSRSSSGSPHCRKASKATSSSATICGSARSSPI